MKGWTSVLFLCLCVASGYSQSRAELEAERSRLLQQIALNNQLLAKSEKEQSTTLQDIERIQSRINLQQQVIDNIQGDLTLTTTAISRSERNIKSLNASLDDLQSRHIQQVKHAYISKKMENKFVFLLSANSMNEAFARWRYLEAVNRARKTTYENYLARKDSITIEVGRLQSLRGQKQQLAEDAIEQEKALSGSKKEAQVVLNELRKDEKSIRSELDRQKRESERLAREIETIISAAVEETKTESALPNAPALAALTEDFASNKGRLPWPVDKGIITGTFGDQPHPVIKSIKISNNGIDFTAPPGQPVRAVFNGEVVGLKVIPGFDYMIIIRHGAYYSVYSRLYESKVKVGDKVTTGQVIGKLASDNTKKANLHLEVWKNKVQQNPESWIAR